MTGGNQHGPTQQDAAEHDEVVGFLSRPGVVAAGAEAVEHMETHAARVFLAGDRAVKIKKPVRLGYLDFSSLDKRREVLARELEINRPNAPEIYDDLVAVVRQADGELALGGDGEPVEWALLMHRFDNDQVLERLARQRPLDAGLARAMADAVLDAHRRAPVAPDADSVAAMQALIDQLAHGLANHAERLGEAQTGALRPAAEAALERAKACLGRRAASGWVRRCHGDLHLGNIVLIGGRPVLFDALEFDEALATIDVLYDLAFLLMDLIQRGQLGAANRVLNRYLSGAPEHDEALVALPLFLGLRAAVRAMVTADRADQAGAPVERWQAARDYLEAALGFLDPPPARLVAVGGFSGTGKTTLAAALAPDLGPAPGAVHVRSDVERKALFGVPETARLDPSHYDAATTARVYRRLEERALSVLAAGHAVIVDAVFAQPEERDAVAAVARRAGKPFSGVWLTADREQLARRVAARRNDASDATPAVMAQQVERGAGAVAWPPVDASGDLQHVIDDAWKLLEKTARRP